MLSWCISRRAAVLAATAGVLLVALFVHWLAPATGKAVRKAAARPLSIPGPGRPEAAPTPAPVVPQPIPPYVPAPMTGVAPPPATVFPPVAMVPPVVDFSAKSIDQLLNDLDFIRSKKGELDTHEKKLMAVLRLKLAEQDQRLRKHGLTPEGSAACCTAPSAVEPMISGMRSGAVPSTTSSSAPSTVGSWTSGMWGMR